LGVERTGGAWLEKVADLDWQVAGIGDFDLNRKPDILWRNTSTGENYVWFMNGTTRTGGSYLESIADSGWYAVP
jgi:hypothetical protein